MIGGFASYGDIAQTKRPFGSLRKGADEWKGFFRQAKTDAAMDDATPDLADAVGSEDYAKAADIATRAGDHDRAMAYAKLANDKQEQLANAAYRNAMVGLQRDKINADAADKAAAGAAKAAEAEQRKQSRLGNIDAAISVIEDNPWAFSSVGNSMVMRGLGLSGDRAARGEVYGRVAQEIQGLQAELAANKVAASTMNSDTEGRRALGVLADPSSATGTELVAALKIAKKALQGDLATPMSADTPGHATAPSDNIPTDGMAF